MSALPCFEHLLWLNQFDLGLFHCMPLSSSLLTLMLQQEAHSGAALFPRFILKFFDRTTQPSFVQSRYLYRGSPPLRAHFKGSILTPRILGLCCFHTVFFYSTALILALLGLYGRCLARPLHLSFHVLTARGNMLPCPPFQCCLLRETPLSAPLALHGGLTVH